jgi:excisionase family DNA binding protein
MQLLTAKQVSESLSLPLQRVYELTRKGTLPHVRIFRQVRYSPDALRQWIEQGGTVSLSDTHDQHPSSDRAEA